MTESTDTHEGRELVTTINNTRAGETFKIESHPHFLSPLEFYRMHPGNDYVFYALETEPTSVEEREFKVLWKFVIYTDKGGPNNGIIEAQAESTEEIPPDATLADLEPPENYAFNQVTSTYPRAFNF